MNHDLSDIERDLQYTFSNKVYLQVALTHTSYSHEHTLEYSNERFELLGDAVLHLVLTEFLMQTYPKDNEGQLSVSRSYCESEPFLYEAAVKMNLGRYLNLGKGEEASGGRNKESLLADTLEAVIAAVHIDGGYKKAEVFILHHISEEIKRAHDEEFYIDSKSELQKLTQQLYSTLPKYKTVEESGPDHEKNFIVSVTAGGVNAEGCGRNKKNAEKEAARKAIAKIQSCRI
ncbi:MAG: ribonuclease III [Deferribacteraceae bacterium]|jgi:ribonuclease-3|nr:ribonuclease III [Deferribacteraceae bacterium]